VQTLGKRAYALAGLWRRPVTIAVDVGSGRVLRRTETPWVQLLVPDTSSLAVADG
jgi:hypothetical protein